MSRPKPPPKSPCKFCGEMTWGGLCQPCYDAEQRFIGELQRAAERYVKYRLSVRKGE